MSGSRPLAFRTFADISLALDRPAPTAELPVVCVQGLGFVGSAVAVAVADARTSTGSPAFNVVGVDMPNALGRTRVDAINAGRLALKTADFKLLEALRSAHARGNLLATTDESVYALASITIVNVPFDIDVGKHGYSAKFHAFRQAIGVLGRYMRCGSLVIIETTVPPGTCERVVAPELAIALAERGLPPDSILLAHSPERVMPGNAYLDSIVNYWRCYAGHTEAASEACEDFLKKYINVDDFPLVRLNSTTASELVKVLENTFRASTIALMDESARFAEAVGVDLFEVVQAIRKRPTHSNIRQPGFGVGGYCLTKDPLLTPIAARDLFHLDDLEFPFVHLTMKVNRAMPLVSLVKLKSMLDGGFNAKTILLMGVSYRADVGDTRESASATFLADAEAQGASVICHDPLVEFWPEVQRPVFQELPSLERVDAIIFCVQHEQYRTLNFRTWLNGSRPIIVDANDVLTHEQRAELAECGCPLTAIGRG